MEIRKTQIPGCCKILPNILKDERGVFVKTFNSDLFSKHGLESKFTESYYTISNYSVLRGMHFQTPPKDHTKIVYCVSGEVLDAIVDLRKGSPTFGKFEIIKLSFNQGNMLYIPPGIAHGFYVLSPKATLIYYVSSVYSPEHDKGILWNSVNIPWPNLKPIISDRDKKFLPFSEYQSPFVYQGHETAN